MTDGQSDCRWPQPHTSCNCPGNAISTPSAPSRPIPFWVPFYFSPCRGTFALLASARALLAAFRGALPRAIALNVASPTLPRSFPDRSQRASLAIFALAHVISDVLRVHRHTSRNDIPCGREGGRPPGPAALPTIRHLSRWHHTNGIMLGPRPCLDAVGTSRPARTMTWTTTSQRLLDILSTSSALIYQSKPGRALGPPLLCLSRWL